MIGRMINRMIFLIHFNSSYRLIRTNVSYKKYRVNAEIFICIRFEKDIELKVQL